MNANGLLHCYPRPAVETRIEVTDIHYRRQPLGAARQGQLDAYGFVNGVLHMLLDSPVMIAKGVSHWAPAKYANEVLSRQRLEIR